MLIVTRTSHASLCKLCHQKLGLPWLQVVKRWCAVLRPAKAPKATVVALNSVVKRPLHAQSDASPSCSALITLASGRQGRDVCTHTNCFRCCGPSQVTQTSVGTSTANATSENTKLVLRSDDPNMPPLKILSPLQTCHESICTGLYQLLSHQYEALQPSANQLLHAKQILGVSAIVSECPPRSSTQLPRCRCC
jgi:hypothetical protein